MPRNSSATEMNQEYQSDHDILIQLAITQKLNHEAQTQQIASVKADVVEVKDGNSVQLARMDARLAVLETFKETKVAEEKINRWNKMADIVEEQLNDKMIVRRDKSIRFTETLEDRWKFLTPAVFVIVGFFYWLLQTYVIPAIVIVLTK